MKFEFDSEKSEVNRQKHGLSLREATQLWDMVHVEIEARTIDEPRVMAIGTLGGKLYACIYTLRGDTIRLISCRRAHEKEARIYHAHIKESLG